MESYFFCWPALPENEEIPSLIGSLERFGGPNQSALDPSNRGRFGFAVEDYAMANMGA